MFLFDHHPIEKTKMDSNDQTQNAFTTLTPTHNFLFTADSVGITVCRMQEVQQLDFL